jgi:20S proteasome alpha/beta subunit
VTVCIAGICNYEVDNPMIVVVADRMITGTDVQYEPEQQSKLYYLTPKIGALIAGDASPQIAIRDATYRRIQALDVDQNEKLTVQQVANYFSEEHANYRRREAEQVFLLPLGMNTDTFRDNQKSLNAKFVSETVEAIQNHSIGNTQTIIMGIDSDLGGQLLYVDKCGVIRSDNLAGFSTAGIGEWHAASHLMLVGYEKSWSVNRALFHLYHAKRKAEAAPGIGRKTDLYFVDHQGIKNFDPRIVDLLIRHIEDMEKQMAPIANTTLAKFDTELTSLLKEKVSEAEKARQQARIEAEQSKEEGKAVAETWTGPTGPVAQ